MSFDEQMAAGGRALRDEVARSIDVDAAHAATLARRAGTDDTVDSRARRSRVLVGVAAAALAGVAGVGLWAVSADREPGQIAPVDSTPSTPDSTDPPTSVATTAVPNDVEGLSGGLGTGFSAEAVFTALPSTVTTADGVVDGSEARLWATAADLATVEDVTRRPRPTAESAEEWLASTFGTGGVTSGGVVLVPPEFPLGTAVESTSQQRRDELGFDLVDTDRYATVGSFGLGFVGVYVGDDLALADSFVDVGGGVVSLGTGEDFHRSVDQISPLRPFGQSLRATTTQDAIVLGWATGDIAAWREGDRRLIDDERLSAAAGVLDRHQLLDVNAVMMDFTATERTRGDVTITEPFDVVATGTAIDGDQLVTIVSYVFADETAATAMRRVIEELWRRPTTSDETAPAELYTSLEVEVIGRTVTITAHLAEGTTTNNWVSYLAVGDAIFAHRASSSAPASTVPASASAAFDVAAAFGDIGPEALAVTDNGRVVAAKEAQLLVRERDGSILPIDLPAGSDVAQAWVGTDQIAVVWGSDGGAEVDIVTGEVVSQLTQQTDGVWTRTITAPDGYRENPGRPQNPLGLGLLVHSATVLPAIEGAGCFESVYFDEGPSWTIAQPADCSASVNEIAPLVTGGYLVTLRPPETVSHTIYPYALHPDGTVETLPQVDASDTGFDSQPTPDGLTTLDIEGGVARVEHWALP